MKNSQLKDKHTSRRNFLKTTAAKKVATDFNTTFIPFQSMFDKAIKKAPAEYWAADGVHPTMAGAYLMAQRWIKAVL